MGKNHLLILNGVNDKEVIFNEGFNIERDTNWISEDDSSILGSFLELVQEI